MPTRSQSLASRSNRFPEGAHILFREGNFFHLQIYHYVRGVALSQHYLITGTHQLIFKLNERLTNVLHMSAHDDLIVIACRSLVAATRVDHGDAAAVVLLHVAVRKTELPQQFYPPDFEPDKVIRMIDHTHLVGLGVAHPQTSLAD